MTVQERWGTPDPVTRWSSLVLYSLVRDPRSIAGLVGSDRDWCSWWSWKDGLKWETRATTGGNSGRRVTRFRLILNTAADMSPRVVLFESDREPQRCCSYISVTRVLSMLDVFVTLRLCI